VLGDGAVNLLAKILYKRHKPILKERVDLSSRVFLYLSHFL
jgi:hypothetical protein